MCEIMNIKHKSNYLPQISAPYTIVLDKLDDNGINYEMVDVNSDMFKTIQGITISDVVQNMIVDDKNPIWISNDNKILDGCHRLANSMLNEKKIKAVKVDLNEKDACRILNKIQDIYEYEQAKNIEEIVGNDVINDENDIENNYTDRQEFLAALEEDNSTIDSENSKKNETTIIAYRKEPIKENSVVGNFFMLNPIEGYDKYEILFDNLLNTDDFGVTYKESQNPIDILAKIWFPNINFEKISAKYNTSPDNLKSKAIAEKANKLGYDGILYENKILQGLK
jgi:hypothetical protein